MAARNQREFAVAWDVAGLAGVLAGALVLSAAALWTWGEVERIRQEAIFDAHALIADVERQRDANWVPHKLPSARRERLADQTPPGAVVVRAAAAPAQTAGLSADWRRDRRWMSEINPYARGGQAGFIADRINGFESSDYSPEAVRPKRSEEMVSLADGRSVPRWVALQGSDPLQPLGEGALLDELWRASSEVSIDNTSTNRLVSELGSIMAAPTPTLDDPHLKVIVESRKEFAGLPFIWGEKSKCTPQEAESFHQYSSEMRRSIASSGEQRSAVVEKVLFQPRWSKPEALKALNQMLPAEGADARMMWCDKLAAIEDPQAAQALAKVAVFDPSPGVRDYARTTLASKPARDYRSVLLAALRFPWPPAAQHAAEALVAVDDQNAVGLLTEMVDLPDPRLAYRQEDGSWVRSHLVRIDHQKNCVLCHAPAHKDQRLLRASITQTVEYYADRTGPFVRADITHLRQELSMSHPTQLRQDLEGPASGPRARFDYLVQVRAATQIEIEEAQAQALAARSKPIPAALAQASQPLDWTTPRTAPVIENPFRDAVLFALRRLTSMNPGNTSPDWRKAYWDNWVGPEHEEADNGEPVLRPQRSRL